MKISENSMATRPGLPHDGNAMPVPGMDLAPPFSRRANAHIPHMRMMQPTHIPGGVRPFGGDESPDRDVAHRLARKTCAACFQALHQIHGETAADSRLPLDHGVGRPPRLVQPRDLLDSFQKFLDHPGLGTDKFSSARSRPTPGLPGVRTTGGSVNYSFNEIKHAEPGARRHIVITIDSAKLQPEGPMKGLRQSFHRWGEAAKMALGADGDMTDFGEALGDWVSQLRKSDPDMVVTVQGSGRAAAAASKAFTTSIQYGQALKLNLFNPAPLLPPGNPHAFAKGVEKLGGMQQVRQLAATFQAAGASMKLFEHLPGASALSKLSDADWNPRAFSMVYDYQSPPAGDRPDGPQTAHDLVHGLRQPMTARSGSMPIGAVYLSQQRKADRLL